MECQARGDGQAARRCYASRKREPRKKLKDEKKAVVRARPNHFTHLETAAAYRHQGTLLGPGRAPVWGPCGTLRAPPLGEGLSSGHPPGQQHLVFSQTPHLQCYGTQLTPPPRRPTNDTGAQEAAERWNREQMSMREVQLCAATALWRREHGAP